MNKFFQLFLLVLLPAAVFSQEQTAADSLYIYEQAAKNIRFIRLGATQLQGAKISKYGMAGLSYGSGSGHFRVAQEAEKSREAKFFTEGVSTLDRFKLYGYFFFKRSWDDSLAFNQKGIKNSIQPAYFIAGKAGDFERQTFTGGGIISYAVKKDKLFISTGIDYLYNSTAGSIDPRALVYTYKLIFNPEISYRFDNQVIGLGVTAGYGDETVTVKIKNKNFGGSQAFPDRISYLNYGYGFIQVSTNDFFRKNTYTGLNLSYAGQLKDWNLAAKLSYLVTQEDNQFKLENGIQFIDFETFQLQNYTVDLLASKKGRRNSQQVSFHYSKDNGDDQLISLAARNYTYKRDDAAVSYSYLSPVKRGKNYEWEAGLQYQSAYQKDAAASHVLKYTVLNPEIKNIRYWHQPNRDLLSAAVGLAARLPLNTDVQVPATQVNVFTSGVVYPDYLYWSSKAGRASFKFNYATDRLIQKFRTGLSFETSYLKNLSPVNNQFNTAFVPSDGYFMFNVGLNLYL